MYFKCVDGCADCCIYRDYYPDKRHGKIGVLIMPSEKEKMEKHARGLGKSITMLPRIGAGSVFRDGKKVGPKKIMAYQLMGVKEDGNFCPFLDVDGKERSPHGGYRCMIYENRPLACRAYPVIESDEPVKLDGKCRFCERCCGGADGLEKEIEALTRIKQLFNLYEKDLWRYATGVGNKEDKTCISKGWILETY